MNRLLIVVVLLVVCAIGAGFYFEVFRINAENTDGASHITLTVDQRKIHQGEKNAVENMNGRE